MKKFIVTTCLFLCSMVFISAQSSSDRNGSKIMLGAFAGLNIPQLTGGGGNPLSENWASRQGIAYGLTFNLYTGTQFSWRVDFLYSSEGGQRNGFQALDAVSFNPQAPVKYFYANYKNESILNYLELPVMGKYSFTLSRTSRFYVDFGPYLGYLLKAEQKTGGSSIVYLDAAGKQPVSVNPLTGDPIAVSFDADTKITDQIHTLNFGLTGGFGFLQNVGFGDLILDIRGAYGLTTIQDNPDNGSNHNGNLLISLGYSVPL